MSRAIKLRLTEHKSRIKRYKQKMLENTKLNTKKQVVNKEKKKQFGESSVACHFYEARHNVTDLRWKVIEEVHSGEKTQVERCLLQREAYWMTTFSL